MANQCGCKPKCKSTCGLTVASLTALAALAVADLSTDCVARVRTLEGTAFILDKTSTATPDGITTIAANGGGNWLRNITDMTVYTYQAAWWIDPAAGDDENPGDVQASPIKTIAEFQRRLGPGAPLLPGATSSALGFPIQMTQVNVLSDLPVTDKLRLSATLPFNSLLAFVGKSTVLATDTFDAVTAQSPSTNQAWEVTSAGFPWATYIGKRLRITASATASNVGTIAWVAKEISAGVARLNKPVDPVLPASSDAPSALAPPDRLAEASIIITSPQAGDTFVIEDLTTMWVDSIEVYSGDQSNASPGGLPMVGFAHFNFKLEGNYVLNSIPSNRGGTHSNYRGCRFDDIALIEGASVLASFYTSCCFAGGFVCRYGTATLQSGLSLGTAPFDVPTMLSSGTVQLVNDFLCQGTSLNSQFGGLFRVNQLAIFDAPGSAINLGVGDTGAMTGMSVLGTGARLWGSGNTGAGVDLSAKSYMTYDPAALAAITLTGTGGAFTFDGTATAQPYDVATGTFLPAVATTLWATLGVATPAGFGGAAFDVLKDAKVTPST